MDKILYYKRILAVRSEELKKQVNLNFKLWEELIHARETNRQLLIYCKLLEERLKDLDNNRNKK